MLGIDFASIDENVVDWKAVKLAFRYAYIRATWGDWHDPTWSSEAPRARALGVPVGPYMFLRFEEKGESPLSAEMQARAFCDAVGELGPGDMPPVIDVEFPGGGRTARTPGRIRS